MRTRSKASLATIVAGLAVMAGLASTPVATAQAPDVRVAQAEKQREGRSSPQCKMALRRIDYFQSRIDNDVKRVATTKRRLEAAQAAQRRATGRKAKRRAAKRVAQRRKELRRARATLRHTRAQLRTARSQAEALGCVA